MYTRIIFLLGFLFLKKYNVFINLLKIILHPFSGASRTAAPGVEIPSTSTAAERFRTSGATAKVDYESDPETSSSESEDDDDERDPDYNDTSYNNTSVLQDLASK